MPRPAKSKTLELPAPQPSPQLAIPWALRMRSAGALRTMITFTYEPPDYGMYGGYTLEELQRALLYANSKESE